MLLCYLNTIKLIWILEDHYTMLKYTNAVNVFRILILVIWKQDVQEDFLSIVKNKKWLFLFETSRN